MMVDRSAKVILQLHNRRYRAHISVAESTKFESLAARAYTDDINLCLGAHSAPQTHFRPGQRDDALTRPVVAMIPAVLL